MKTMYTFRTTQLPSSPLEVSDLSTKNCQAKNNNRIFSLVSFQRQGILSVLESVHVHMNVGAYIILHLEC